MSAFAGMSLLRQKEREEKKPLSDKARRMAEYLASQYGASTDADDKQRKKKKAKKQRPTGGNVRILDEDVSGFGRAGPHPAQRGAEEEEDQPVVANPEEAAMLAAQAQKERDLFARQADGSGWAVVDDGRAPRPARHDSSGDASPPRRPARHDSPGDASPPRRPTRHDSPGDASPPRRPTRHDSPGDASPPGRPTRHDSPGGASPPRRPTRHDSTGDASPPRRPTRHDSTGDASPPRRRRGGSTSTSPTRHEQPSGGGDLSPPRKRPAGPAADGSQAAEGDQSKRQRLMSDGTAAGIVSGRELADEMRRKRAAEAQRFAQLGAGAGRAEATVYRDKSGQAVSKDEFVEARAAERRAGKAQYDEESQLAWGGGLAQQAAREEQARRVAEEAAKPFARGPEPELDADQRERLRWGDPMAHLVKRRQPELASPPSLVAAQQERLKKSGFIIPLDVPTHSWLRRGIGAPPNRYGIKPGRHWDGVDRSNGFERDMYKRQTELRRRAQEASMWAQSDM